MMSVLLDFRARSGWGPFNASHFVAVQFHIRNAYVASSKQHYYFLFSSSLSSPLHPLLSPPLLLPPSSSTPSPPPSLNHCWTLKSLSKVVKRSLWLFSFCASGSCSFENLKDIYTHRSTIMRWSLLAMITKWEKTVGRTNVMYCITSNGLWWKEIPGKLEPSL